MKKTTKIIIGITTAVICIIIIASLIIYTQIASTHNKRVDAVAEEIENSINDLSMDLEASTIDSPTAFKYLIELSILDSEDGIDEQALTYYDGSKAKYDEINNTVDELIDSYQAYFKNKNESILSQNSIDVVAASKDELITAINGLNQLISDIDTQNISAKIVDSDWGIIFGDSEEEANNYFNDLKQRATAKLNELQSRLDAINAEEAQAAAEAAASASSSKSSSSSNSYSSGGNSGSSNSRSKTYEEWISQPGEHRWHIGPNGELIQDY